MSNGVDLLQVIRAGVVYLIALILSICVHEWGHAFVADRLGDPVPRGQGRVTLNPIAHIDPVGTLLIPIVGIALGASGSGLGRYMLGWGKPVQVSLSARSIDRRFSLRAASVLISLAGPAMNIVFALLLSGIYATILKLGDGPGVHFIPAISDIIFMNVGLAFFNLIPCPPLDGGSVLRGVLPHRFAFVSDFLDRYGTMLLMVLLVSGALSRFLWPARWLAAHWMSFLTTAVLG